MGPQVSAVTQMHQLRIVQRSLTQNALRSLVQALYTVGWTIYCNALLAGVASFSHGKFGDPWLRRCYMQCLCLSSVYVIDVSAAKRAAEDLLFVVRRRRHQRTSVYVVGTTLRRR